MTMIRNEVPLVERTLWRANFVAESGNIFEAFQRTPIVLTKAIYQALTFNYSCHIRIYFGLDSNDNPKVIAVPAYKLNEIDTPNMESSWDDILKANCIYELYAGTVVTLANAQSWLANWAKNEDDELFVKAFIFPRPNFIDIFDNQGKDYALLDFGIKKEVKVMTQACVQNGTPLANPVFGDSASPCPPRCGKSGLSV